MEEENTMVATMERGPSTPASGTAVMRGVGLSRQYGEGEAVVHALRQVSVEIEAGRFTAIMGPSGSGKSTLMHCLAGLDDLTSGTVWLRETNLTALDETSRTKLRRTRIGFVFQSFNLLPAFTARENILMPLTLAGQKLPDRAALATLADTLGITDRLEHRPAELSGGQQQRVAIARALLPNPDIVFADEPTGNLDSRSGAHVLSFLRSSVDQRGQSIVMVTHDPIAASFADRVLFLADGRLAGEMLNPTREAVLDALRTLGD
jgi:putative ABC transport system ATP-binding protein